jgi:hypothetical protein
MPANQPNRCARAVFGYLGGVATVVVIAWLAWLAIVGLELHFNNSSSTRANGELAILMVLFPLLLILMWVTALVPFVVVRQCGGFVLRKCGDVGNAWQAVVGGIATAVLTIPILVWWGRFLDIENGPAPYLPALTAAGTVPSLWLVVIVGGAIGGLAYWFISVRA